MRSPRTRPPATRTSDDDRAGRAVGRLRLVPGRRHVAGLGASPRSSPRGQRATPCRSPTRCSDGTRVAPGDVVMRVSGPTRGSASPRSAARPQLRRQPPLRDRQQDRAVSGGPGGNRARVPDTRKTPPDPPGAAEASPRCGGGVNHRFSLSDRAAMCRRHITTRGRAAGGPCRRTSRSGAAHPGPGGSRSRIPTYRPAARSFRLEVGCTEIPLDNRRTPPRWPRPCPSPRARHARGVGRADLGAGTPDGRGDRRRPPSPVGALTHSVVGSRPSVWTRRSRPGRDALAADIGNSHTILRAAQAGGVR